MRERVRFSIVIPTYARPRQVADCLESLTRLRYPRDRFEVIVVDDGSPMAIDDIVEPFRSRLNVTLLKRDHRGPAAARNEGLAEARGEFVAFTDDDCLPALNWLETLSTRIMMTSDCAIAGRTLNALSENLYSTASQLIVEAAYEFYNRDAEHARFSTSNNLAFPTEKFRDLGGFNSAFLTAEDREVCDRWRLQGNRIIYAPEAVVYHAHDLTFGTFLKQHFRYGRGASLLHEVRARQGVDQGGPDLEFFVHFLRYSFSLANGWRPWVWDALLMISQGASAFGYLWQWVFRKREQEGWVKRSRSSP